MQDKDESLSVDAATTPSVAPPTNDELAGERSPQTGEEPTESGRSFLREIVETILLTLLLFVIINTVTGRFRIEGQSMLPGLTSDQYILINKVVYRLHPPERGDVVVFHSPREPSKDLIKRVIGLPGEMVLIREGQVFVDGQPLVEPYIDPRNQRRRASGSWELGPDDYFVMGDNRVNSSDSRHWGPLDGDQIIGKAWISYWPPDYWPHNYSIPHYCFPDDLSAERSTVDGG